MGVVVGTIILNRQLDIDPLNSSVPINSKYLLDEYSFSKPSMVVNRMTLPSIPKLKLYSYNTLKYD